MQIYTHVLAGWSFGNLTPLSRRERLFCMIVSLAPDLDGISILFGKDAYQKYHHLLGHNLAVGFLSSLILALVSLNRLKSFFVYFLLFHLHLIMDYWGSGPGWPIAYLWPFSDWEVVSPHAWKFNGWQNTCFFVAFLWWMVLIIRLKKRTPFEILWPRLDRKLVSLR